MEKGRRTDLLLAESDQSLCADSRTCHPGRVGGAGGDAERPMLLSEVLPPSDGESRVASMQACDS